MANDLTFKTTPLSDEKVSIVIVHNDAPAHLNIALQSISANSLNNKYEVIVVDDASETQDAIDYLSELEKQDCKVVRNSKKLWWTKSANIGAKNADPDSRYFVFMHHDIVILSPAWLDFMINIAESQNSGLVGVSMSQYTCDDSSRKRLDVQFIDEWCMLVSKECWQDCGPFDERLEQVGAPFVFTLASNYFNYNPQCISNSLVYHYGVFKMTISDLERFNDKSRLIIPDIVNELNKKAIRE